MMKIHEQGLGWLNGFGSLTVAMLDPRFAQVGVYTRFPFQANQAYSGHNFRHPE